MVDTKKLQEELPIELLQKGICITDEEANNHEILQLTVNEIINLYIGTGRRAAQREDIRNQRKGDHPQPEENQRRHRRLWRFKNRVELCPGCHTELNQRKFR